MSDRRKFWLKMAIIFLVVGPLTSLSLWLLSRLFKYLAREFRGSRWATHRTRECKA